jgi:hypothetical protein
MGQGPYPRRLLDPIDESNLRRHRGADRISVATGRIGSVEIRIRWRVAGLWDLGPVTEASPLLRSALAHRLSRGMATVDAMKQVEHFRWLVPAGNGRYRRTRYAMTREEAAERFPGAVPDEATREVRRCAEGMDEWEVHRHPVPAGGRAKA